MSAVLCLWCGKEIKYIEEEVSMLYGFNAGPLKKIKGIRRICPLCGREVDSKEVSGINRLRALNDDYVSEEVEKIQTEVEESDIIEEDGTGLFLKNDGSGQFSLF